jgi:cyanoexosortase B
VSTLSTNARSFDFKHFPWISGAIVGIFALLYVPLVVTWIHGWLFKSISIEHEYFSHGMLGIPFAGYLAWQLRSQVRASVATGRDLLIGAVICSIAGILYLSNLAELVNFSLPLMLTGGILMLCGSAALRLLAFPLVLVWLATPNEIPYLIAPYTAPLQIFIANIAGFILRMFGFPVVVDQFYLYLNGKQVEVAPYCAGLKMLFTSLYVALLLLHWTDMMRSRKFIAFFLGCAVALSVVGNIIRNTILVYFHGTGQDALFVWLHDSWGGDLYSAGILGILVWWIGKFEPKTIPIAVPKED